MLEATWHCPIAFSSQARQSPWGVAGGGVPPLATFESLQGSYSNTETSQKGYYRCLISNRLHNGGLSLCGINFQPPGFDVSRKAAAWDSLCSLLPLLASARGSLGDENSDKPFSQAESSRGPVTPAAPRASRDPSEKSRSLCSWERKNNAGGILF